MDPQVLTGLIGGASSLVGSGVQYLTQKNYNRQARADYEKHALQQFQYGQQAQRNAASNEVIGMRQAGLNPALAQNGNFSAAVGGSSPMQSSSASAPDVSGGIAGLLNALTNRFNADTNKQNADTNASSVQSQNDLREEQRTAVQRDNAREDSYDDTINENIDATQKVLANSDNSVERALGEALGKRMYDEDGERNDEIFNSGALRAYRDFLNIQSDMQSASKRVLESKLGQQVLAAQISNPQVRSALENMPAAEYASMVAFAQQALSAILLNVSRADWTKEDIGRIQSEIGKLEADTDLAKNKDWLTLLRNGEFLWGLMRVIGNAAGTAADLKLKKPIGKPRDFVKNPISNPIGEPRDFKNGSYVDL